MVGSKTDVNSRYVWWARKAQDASSSTHDQEPVLDDELIQTDEEDSERDAVDAEGVTNVPLPSTTDVTQASVDQLSALAVSDEAPTSGKNTPAVPAAESEELTSSGKTNVPADSPA
jgi:hypothetical protein